MRRFGLPGNVCNAVLRLGPGLDVVQLRRRVESSPILDWLSRVRVVRPFPVLAPLWCTGQKPRDFFHEYSDPDPPEQGPAQLPQVIAHRELHAAHGPSLAFDLVRHPDQSFHLVFSWNHALMDARGADLVLHHLNAGAEPNGAPTVDDVIHPPQRGYSLSGWWTNVKTARGSIGWLHDSGREPLFSLLPGLRPAGPCRNQYRIVLFTKEETARIGARSERLNASFRRSHFYLAAALRAVHTIATARGNKDGAYLVPVPHDTRRRGTNGPIFSNHLSILFYRIEPDRVGSLSAIIAEITRQMMEQIRTRFPEACMAALNMFKPLPLGYYVHHLGEPTRGKFATFCFSDSGETCGGMTELLGAPIQAVTHFVPSWRPPGLTFIFLSFNGRLSALMSWVDDCLSPDEVNTVEATLRTALLDEEIS